MKMKQYKAHQTVHAEPQREGVNYGFDDSEPELAGRDGYRVIFSKGTDDEYEKWIPKRWFEEGYSEWNNFDFDEPDVCETCSS